MGEEAQCGVGSVHSVLADLSHGYPFRAFSTSTPQSELGNLDVSQRVAGARLPNGIHEGQHGQQTRATRMQTVQRLHVVRSTAQPSVRSLLQLRHALVPLLHHFLIVRHVLPFSSALFATLRCSSNPCNDCSNTPRTRWFSFVSTLHTLRLLYLPPDARAASPPRHAAAECRSSDTSRPRSSHSQPSEHSSRPSPCPSSATSDRRYAWCGIAANRAAGAWSA